MSSSHQHWIHDLSPFLIRFPDNPLGIDGIRYYGLAYLLAFLSAWLLLRLYNQKGRFLISKEECSSLMTAVILGVLLGGRFGYMVLYEWETFLQNPLFFFRVDQGGMASHGGVIGVAVALIYFARKRFRFLELSDSICSIAPLGLLFGRIANFINAELWGRPSSASWAVIFPQSPASYNPDTGIFEPLTRHPSQLYQAALEGGLLFAYLQWRFWLRRPSIGMISGEFLCGYSILRSIGELFREPDASLIAGMSRGQFYSLFMLLTGLLIIARVRKTRKISN